MAKYILKRVIYMIPLALFVTLIIFLIMSFTPGDPATNNLPITTEPHVKQAYNESVGYTDSLGTRYMNFLKGLLKGEVLSYSSRNNVFDGHSAKRNRHLPRFRRVLLDVRKRHGPEYSPREGGMSR